MNVERDASDACDVARKTGQTGVRVIKISGASGDRRLRQGPKTSFTVYSFLARVLVTQPTTKEVHFGSGKADLPGRHVALYTDLALPVCERQAGGGDLRRLVGPDGFKPGPVPHR